MRAGDRRSRGGQRARFVGAGHQAAFRSPLGRGRRLTGAEGEQGILAGPAWQSPESPRTSAAPIETPTQRLASLSASALRSLLEMQNMWGPASHLFSQSVNGTDFLELDEKQLVDEVRVTPFVAKKLVRVRAELLEASDRSP